MRRPRKSRTPTSQFVTATPELELQCERWRGAGAFAFDTEFIRDDTYEAILCLIQVCDGKSVALIDPTDGIDLSPFWELVCDPSLVKVVHAGKEDLDLCLKATGRPPARIFDVQIAAGLVGYGYPLSLARLVRLTTHHRIEKGATLTDWLRRPLTEEQIQYAIEDVAHLPAAHRRLVRKIEALGRHAWAEEEFARFEQPGFYRPPVRERLVRVKGSRKLDRLGLAVLERLVSWRDDWAAQRNRPVRAMVRDDILVEIALRRPTKPSELEVLRGFPQARNAEVVRRILEEIRAAEATPEADWPAAPETLEETPTQRGFVEVLSAVLRARCEEQNVDVDLVGTAARVRELLDYAAAPRGACPSLLCGWRGDFVGRSLLDVLEGRLAIRLSGWPDKPRLRAGERTPAAAGGAADPAADGLAAGPCPPSSCDDREPE